MKNKTKKIIVIGCTVVLGVIILLGGVGAYTIYRIGKYIENFDEEQQVWIECAVKLPEGYGKLTFLRRHIHPFMAEYSRKVRIETPDSEPVCCPLPINVGGRTLINLYWIEKKEEFGPMLLMRDHWGEYLIDIEQKKALRLVKPEAGRVFAVEINDERSGIGWWRLPNGELRVYSFGNVSTDITQNKVYDHLKYIGRLDGRTARLRFVASSKSPEEKIRMVRPRGEPFN